jgi:protein disulfide-isomerase A1
VDDYPTLLFYPVGDKENPVIISGYVHFHIHYFSTVYADYRIHEAYFIVQVKLSTKSSSKDLATVIKSLLRAKEDVPKDEL